MRKGYNFALRPSYYSPQQQRLHAPVDAVVDVVTVGVVAEVLVVAVVEDTLGRAMVQVRSP